MDQGCPEKSGMFHRLCIEPRNTCPPLPITKIHTTHEMTGDGGQAAVLSALWQVDMTPPWSETRTPSPLPARRAYRPEGRDYVSERHVFMGFNADSVSPMKLARANCLLVREPGR